MFTGIIEETGKVERIRRGILWQFTLRAEKVMEDLKVGDSISVNGVCLTVTSLEDSAFSVDVTAETLKRSNLGRLTSGSAVNLERALRAADRLGGHLVSGHIDGMGAIAQRTRRSGAEIVNIRVPEEILRYVVPQGSVAVDGVSLTVLDTFPGSFAASLIPHTALVTTLADKRIGEKVNIEVDVVGKYVERFVGAKHSGRRSTREVL